MTATTALVSSARIGMGFPSTKRRSSSCGASARYKGLLPARGTSTFGGVLVPLAGSRSDIRSSSRRFPLPPLESFAKLLSVNRAARLLPFQSELSFPPARGTPPLDCECFGLIEEPEKPPSRQRPGSQSYASLLLPESHWD